MSFLDKVTDAGKGVTGKMQNYSEVNNLRRKILYEEERIIEIFADIGKKYYKNPEEDPQTENSDKNQYCGVCGARLPDIDDADFTSLEDNDYYTESNQIFNADPSNLH